MLSLATVGNSQRRNYLSVSALETTFYMRNQLLRDADWAGMAHSVEIRVPLVDPWLYRALAPLRNGKFRPNKEDMIARLQPPLPDEVRTRSKTGFNIPVREWLQENHERGLRGWAKHVLKHFQPGLLPAQTWPFLQLRRISVVAMDEKLATVHCDRKAGS